MLAMLHVGDSFYKENVNIQMWRRVLQYYFLILSLHLFVDKDEFRVWTEGRLIDKVLHFRQSENFPSLENVISIVCFNQ